MSPELTSDVLLDLDKAQPIHFSSFRLINNEWQLGTASLVPDFSPSRWTFAKMPFSSEATKGHPNGISVTSMQLPTDHGTIFVFFIEAEASSHTFLFIVIYKWKLLELHSHT